jgi:hypothetical protein
MLCNEWNQSVNTSQLHEDIGISDFWSTSSGAPKKRRVGPKLHLFLGVEFLELDVFGWLVLE